MINKPINPVLIIGIGNEFRRDDAVGLHVARLLESANLPDVRVLVRSGEGASLMETWSGHECVHVIDATSSGAAPGTIRRLDASAEPVPVEFFHYSTHAFSLAEAVEMARALDQLPPQLVIHGIEGSSFSAGRELSPVVAAAAAEIARRIQDEIAAQPATGPRPPPSR